MALQGTLDTFALADLVQLLASTQKTGELMIEGDRGSGRLWFLDGALVGVARSLPDTSHGVKPADRAYEGKRIAVTPCAAVA